MPEPIKNFRELTVPELEEVASAFGVDFEPGSNKNSKISELSENGVTIEMWNEIVAAAEPDEENAPEENDDDARPEPPRVEKPEEDKVLVKMTRFNNTYHIRGYQFNRQHPFALVTEADADYLCRVDGGFQMATPGEAREFYN